MSKNFYGASKTEDDFAFEEADDPRTWFPDRTIEMDCEKDPVKEPIRKEKFQPKKEKNSSPNFYIRSNRKNSDPMTKNGVPWWLDD